MPALYTHYKFGHDVLNSLNPLHKEQINNNIRFYNIWNQGWDNLYYHFNTKFYKELGKKAHKKNVNTFFKELISYIKNHKLEHNSEITTILYGFINHYVLDTIMHPYINYLVKKINISHTKIEYIIDNMLYKNNYSIIFKPVFFKTLIPKIKFKNSINDCLNKIFEKTYNVENIGNVINISHNNSYYLYKYFLYDRYGIKTFIYKIIDIITPFKTNKIHKNIYSIKDYNIYILNNDNYNWNHPKNNNESYNYSFSQLYDYSLKIAVEINDCAFNVLNNNNDINEFLNLISIIDIKNIQAILQK